MTLESTINKNRYVGNGATKVFPFTFHVWKTDQVLVFVGNGTTEENVTSGCTITLSSSGGSVAFNVAPPSGKVIVIRRNMPYIQEDDYRNGTRFDSEEIEDRLDQDCAERQDLRLDVGRAIKVPLTSNKTPEEWWADFVALVGDLQTAKDLIWAWLQAIGSDAVGTATPVIAAGGTAFRTLGERFGDIICAEDFGAKGDGVTDDTAAFAALEESFTDRRVNLHNKTFKVYTPPSKNYYYNGYWKQTVSFDSDPLDAGKVVMAHDDDVRMLYGSEHGAGSQTRGRNFCILNNIDVDKIWKKNLKDVVAIGEDTLKKAVNSSGQLSGCIAIGRGAMAVGAAPGYQNIAIGTYALRNVNGGDRNIAIGSLAMLFATSCRQSICLGRDSGQCITDGTKNTILGYQALAGYAPVGLSSWIERQNEVVARRLTVLGCLAGARLSGLNKDAVIIGEKAAANAKKIEKSLVIGASACLNSGRDISQNNYDLLFFDDINATYVTDGSSTIALTLSSTIGYAVVGSSFVLGFSENTVEGSPFEGVSELNVVVTAISGTSASVKIFQYVDNNISIVEENLPAFTGNCVVRGVAPCSYTINSDQTITFTVSSALQNQAVVNRMVCVALKSGNVATRDQNWLKVTSSNLNSFTCVNNSKTSEGATGGVEGSGSGEAVIYAFEKSTKTNDTAGHFPALSTVVGNFACMNSKKIYESCVFGYLAASEVPTLYRATVFGYRAAQALSSASETVVIGSFSAAGSNSNYDKSVVVGCNTQSAANAEIENSVAVGFNASFGSSGNLSVAVGYFAGPETGPSDRSVYVGARAGSGITVAESARNVAIGYEALAVNPGGEGEAIAVSDCIALGHHAAVTGSSQCQLGDTGTTTYAYGSVQDRSDARDKADIRDCALGLDFIKALRPVDFRWDYRSDYVDYVEQEDGMTTTVQQEKDGSRKRARFHHGLIAQEVKTVMDAQGVDFGGYQDHKINGGADVLTLGYEEFIAPIIKSIQELNTRLEALEGV